MNPFLLAPGGTWLCMYYLFPGLPFDNICLYYLVFTCVQMELNVGATVKVTLEVLSLQRIGTIEDGNKCFINME